MKIVLILLGIVALVFIVFQIYFMSTQSDIETYPYTVLEEFDEFEIRQYDASLFTSVKLKTGEYEQASGQGFSILAGYIFGGNDANEQIAMTSPVTMSLEDSMTMMFMVPKAWGKDQLPKPNQSAIEFKEVPEKKVAAISFGGWANAKRIDEYKNRLITALEANGISYSERFSFLGYNAPFEVVNRKNEVIVEL